MICPFCQSDDLLVFVEDNGEKTHCCENCGGSFQIVQEPQDFPKE
jgi:uncharacterized protein YbaR (Trm112 family)